MCLGREKKTSIKLTDKATTTTQGRAPMVLPIAPDTNMRGTKAPIVVRLEARIGQNTLVDPP